MHAEVLIIGAGPAGLSAAKAAQKSGKQVVLAGAEHFPPYFRPRLPDIIRTGEPAESIFMQNTEWFKTSGILFLPSKKASSIEPSQKSVKWEDGTFTEYETLILACGSLSNIPSVPFAEKVYPLRTFEDAIEIRKACLSARKAFIVGGGVLGLEIAFAVSQLGISVNVYDIVDYPLSRQLDREGGLFLKKQLAEKKIIIHSGASLENFQDDIKNSCVIAAAGVRPAVKLAEKCGIKINRGILVDEHMRTSIPDIYACGDMAEFAGAIPGLMAVATKQGEVAGINASGGDAVYSALLPSPMTRVAGISILSIGSVNAGENSKIYRKINGNNYAMAVVTGKKITGAAFIGNTAPGMKLKKHIEAGTEIGPVSSFEDIEKACGLV
jgi:NAD(P)H-nitrite reductase large subunit